MSDAYNVRSNGQRYYVYRMDGNVQVAEFFNASEAQRECAIRNQQHNERFAKKKETPEVPPSQAWVEKQLPEDKGIGKGFVPDPPPGQGVSY